MIKLHPYLHRYPVTGPNYRPMWEFAHQTGAVVLSHTWESDPTCGPLLFEEIARQFSHARIVLGHSGVTRKGYEESIQVARKHGNLYLDTTGSQSHNGILEHCDAKVGSDRILFGSDLPFLEAAMGIGRVVFARLSDSRKEAILGQNFRRLVEEH
jgi:predicted TIM-barrel fold metal-dependent hydrolase